jgi:alpha-amylase
MLLARKLFAYGAQDDYFDHPNCIAWIRHGDEYHPGGLAVIMSNSNAKGHKRLNIGKHRAGEVWVDMMGYWKDPVVIKEDGSVKVYCHSGSVSLWVPKEEGKSWIICEESSSPEEAERHGSEEQYVRDHADDDDSEEEKKEEEFEAKHPDLPKSLDTWDHLLEDDDDDQALR